MEWMILPLKRYADFQGRSRRKEFWMFQLFNLIVSTVLAGPAFVGIFSAAMAAEMGGDPDPFAGMGTFSMVGFGLYGLYALAILIPSIAVTVRRLHDRDMSGWWYLGLMVVSLIPFIGFIASIAFLVILALPGTEGPNRFGADPKNPYDEQVFS